MPPPPIWGDVPEPPIWLDCGGGGGSDGAAVAVVTQLLFSLFCTFLSLWELLSVTIQQDYSAQIAWKVYFVVTQYFNRFYQEQYSDIQRIFEKKNIRISLPEWQIFNLLYVGYMDYMSMLMQNNIHIIKNISCNCRNCIVYYFRDSTYA